MNDKLLSIDKVSVSYKTRLSWRKAFVHKALNKVSFDLFKGDVIGLIGGNGSGKSTLLKVVAGVYLPDSGDIHVEGKIKRSLLTLGLGFNEELTGRDNVILSFMLSGLTKAQGHELVEHVKIFSDLAEFFEQPVRTYSTGMRARLGFSSALYLDTHILLIDETLSVGDRPFHVKAEAAIKQKLSSSQSVIIVSHDLNQINDLCNRCIWLDKGNVISDGPTEEVLREYEEHCDLQ